MTMDTTDARAVQLCQSSKVVIEITQPRPLQAFEPLCSVQKPFSEFEDVLRPLLLAQQQQQQQERRRSLRHTVSQPNLMMMMTTRSTSSVLGRRRSASPPGDDMAFGSSKKRRADSFSGSVKEEGGGGGETTTGAAGITLLTPASASASASAAVAEAAAAANVARQQQQQQQQQQQVSCTDNGSGLQIVGVGYEDKMDMMTSNSKEIGLGVCVPSETGGMIESPTIDALRVAKAFSYEPLEEQKGLGIDSSLFTRVETAGWRILIPPNVMASFRSEDFGLTLKPKTEEEDGLASSELEERPQGLDTDNDMLDDEEKEICKLAVREEQEDDVSSGGNVMEAEEEMDELEDG
ncbi:hypothetical protein BGX34_001858 [Mortierella sp. NVP85]|nr:hypothetical protein BGX34_001858 [Mortierella sp. NVP85]